MQEQMQLLKDLQGLDQELNRLGQEHRKLEAEQTALNSDLERIRSMVDSLNADIDRLQVQRGEFGQALAHEQENVKKAEGRLPTIKTQKEYVAVLKEIDTAKKMNKEIQDRIQEKSTEIDALSRDREEKEAELAAAGDKVGARQTEIAARLAESDSAMTAKRGERDSLLNQLPPSLRKRYQLLMERRGGVAVVEARNGACLGCHMHLPPQLFNSLFRTQEIQSCPHCNRMLFIQAGV